MSYPPEPPPWQEAQVELATVIGEVTLSMTAIEASLDELILDILVQPPMFSFFKRRLLGRWMVGAKIELLNVGGGVGIGHSWRAPRPHCGSCGE